MSTIKFRIRGKSDKNVNIKIRLSIDRKNVFEVNSGFEINPKYWNVKNGFPIQKLDDNKILGIHLNDLNSFVNKKLMTDKVNNVQINSNWLQDTVDEFNGKKKTEIEEVFDGLLLSHIEKYINEAPNKKNKSSIGLSESTIKKYITFKNSIIAFEKDINKKIRLIDIDKNFTNKFQNWLLKTKGFSVNYAGKHFDQLKTICNDANEYEIPINPYFTKIESFKTESNDRYIVTFTEEEIEKLKSTIMPNERLENAKRWILLGIEIGQRGSDLLQLSKDNICQVDEDGKIFLEVFQQKTKKNVVVGIGDPFVLDIFNNHFPYVISIQKLNEYIKDVCEECGFTEEIKGFKFDAETKRKVIGMYPKCQLLTSHSFRRTFATKWYGIIPTPILMDITGHTRESQFREYINVREDKLKSVRMYLEQTEQYRQKLIDKDEKERLTA